jgi:DNA repair exonuclease SbcCD ATPase subunit
MIKQLEQAVIAAENAHRRGIYTGLEVDQSLKEVISSNSSKRQLALVDDLMERVGRLHKEWVEKVEEPNQKKEQQAVARFGESKTGDLGVLLARSPEQAGGADIKSIAQELQGALKTKADATIDAQVLSERKVSELKREMQKVENKYQQLMITSHSVADHLKDTEKKIEECKDDIPRLSEHIEKLEALKMAQVQVNKEAKSLAEIAGNHERWFERLDGQEMKSVLDIKPADKILLSDTMKDITKAAGELPTKSSAVGGNLTEIQRHLDKAKEYRRQAELKAGAANANAPPHDAKHRPGLP